MVKNGTKLELGYNAQAGADADSGLVVACDVVAESNDQQQLEPMLTDVERTLDVLADRTVVDTGYAHGAQVEAAQERGREVLFTGLEPKDAPGPYDKARFTYDAARDEYACPRGLRLPLYRVTDKGCEQRAVYRCSHGDACPVRADCTRDPKGRTVDRGPYDEAMERQRARQCQDPEAAGLLARRKVIIEPVFAQVKHNHGFLSLHRAGAGEGGGATGPGVPGPQPPETLPALARGSADTPSGLRHDRAAARGRAAPASPPVGGRPIPETPSSARGTSGRAAVELEYDSPRSRVNTPFSRGTAEVPRWTCAAAERHTPVKSGARRPIPWRRNPSHRRCGRSRALGFLGAVP